MYSKAWFVFVSSCLIVAAAGCGGGGEKAPAEQAPATQGEPAATAQAPAGGTGSVKGAVALSGTAPAQPKIKMDADAYCKTQHADVPATAEKVVVNADGTLRNVFVYVKEGLDGKTFPTPTEPVTIDQHGCTYHPHVFGIMVGQPLKILNSDATLHNIHVLAKNSPQFNLGMPTKGMEITKKFAAEEVMVRIKCDVHPWMESWAGVLKHPFYSVTGEAGTFEIKDLPEGTYTIEAWHEQYGTQTQTVTVKAGEAAQVSFTFQASA